MDIVDSDGLVGGGAEASWASNFQVRRVDYGGARNRFFIIIRLITRHHRAIIDVCLCNVLTLIHCGTSLVETYVMGWDGDFAPS